MAFWGVEVKPGKPFTHLPHSIGGRLHVSQATLGFGTASKKSVVQCNVGNRSPVFLCSLFPEQAESCQLNLEFEEADEVVFSIIGPRSVHLTGYYLGSSRQCKVDDESESYGEDILDTETDRSDGNGDEDEYEDSFIDDDDLQAIPPSPSLSDEVAEETLLGDRKKDAKEKSAKAKHRRLRKKYQSTQTDDDFTSKQQALSNDGMGMMEKESEDTTTISSLVKSAARAAKPGAQEDTGQVIVTDCELLRKPHEYYHTQPSNVYNDVKPKKKMKKKPTKEKEDKVEDDFFSDQVLTWDKGQQNQMKVDQSNQDTALMNGDTRKSEKDKGESPLHFYLPSDEVIGGIDAKTGKRKNKRTKETKALGVDKTFNIVDNEDKSQKGGRERTEQDSLLKTREDEKQANDEGGNPLHSSMPSDESVHEIVAKTGKRKKKQAKEEKSLGANIPVDNVSREDQAQPDEATCENTVQGSLLKSGDIPKQANDEGVNSLHSDELVHGIEAVPKPKKKRKKPAKDGALEADANRSKIVIEACGDEQNKMQTVNV